MRSSQEGWVLNKDSIPPPAIPEAATVVTAGAVGVTSVTSDPNEVPAELDAIADASGYPRITGN